MDATLDRISFHQLTDDQLLDLLATEEDRLTRATVDEFVSRGERMIGRLSDLCRDERSWKQHGPRFWAPVHATYILGAFEDERALKGLLASLRWSARYDVDWVYEKMPSILGRLGRAAIAPLKARVSDPEAAELDRLTAVHALAAVGARHPIHQGEVLDYLRGIAEDDEQEEWIRSATAFVLLAFARPGDRSVIASAALRQDFGVRPPLFDAREVAEVYVAGTQRLDDYLRDWLGFYEPEAIETRVRRWRDEAEDARWARGAEDDASWVEEKRERFLTKFEFSLLDLDDESRGDALWVAESMTEYLVFYEGLAPWRWNGATAFAYLMDFFARRVALDDPGRIQAVPGNLLRFVEFCAGQGLVADEDRKAVEECIRAEQEEFLAAALDPERRRVARVILEQMVAQGIDPRDPERVAVPAAPAPIRERKTSRRLRKA